MNNPNSQLFRLFSIAKITIISLLAISCSNNPQQTERTISVLGHSAIYAAPDQVSISFSVVSKDKELSIAKTLNDKAIKNVNELFAKHSIEQKDITIEHITIYPQYSYSQNGTPIFLHYQIDQNISVTITNLDHYEPFLTDILNSGIDRIGNIVFSVREMRKYRDEARTAAVKAAEEKAELLCLAASNRGKNIKLGEVVKISEIPQSYSVGGRMQNSYSLKTKEDNAGNFSPVGQVQIEAEVEVVFGIEK